jgi:colanic acid biosynthesis glycosyl transferase WcaI
VARIVFVTEFFPPESFAGANRVASMVDVLTRSHDVLVVTLKPSYPDPSFYEEKHTLEADRKRPYRVERQMEFVPYSRSLVVRAIREHIMGFRLALHAAREPADIVLTSSPSMFLGPICWLLARVKSSRFAWDIRDIGWEYAGESNLASSRLRPLQKVLTRYMWFVIRRADLIVAATPGIVEQVNQEVASTQKVLLARNSVSKELLDACKACQERVPKPRPIVSYVGLIGDAQALVVLADVARELPSVDFMVVGEGLERGLLERRTEELGLRNVIVTGFLHRAEVLDVYRTSDILFAQLRDTPTLNATGLPSKLYEYMATGKPIVYAGKGLAAKTVERIGCGVSVAPEKSKAIAKAIRELLDDEARMEAMGRKGREFVETGADRENPFEELARALRDCL